MKKRIVRRRIEEEKEGQQEALRIEEEIRNQKRKLIRKAYKAEREKDLRPSRVLKEWRLEE